MEEIARFDPTQPILDQISRKFKDGPLESCRNSPLEISPGWLISIQASESHYCYPRKNLLSLREYETFEVAIMKVSNGDSPFHDDWSIIQPRDYFSSFSWVENFEHGEIAVAPDVHLEVIEEMIRDIARVSPLMFLR